MEQLGFSYAIGGNIKMCEMLGKTVWQLITNIQLISPILRLLPKKMKRKGLYSDLRTEVPRCFIHNSSQLSQEEWINKLGYIHTKTLFRKEMELPKHATLWMSLRYITLNEGSPTKSTICKIPSVEKSGKDKSDLQLWKHDQCLPEAGAGG